MPASLTQCVAGCVVLPTYLVIARYGIGLRLGWVPRSTWLPLIGAVAAGVVSHLVAENVSGAWRACGAGLVAGLAAYLVITGVWLRHLIRRLRALYGKRAVERLAAPDVTSPHLGISAAEESAV